MEYSLLKQKKSIVQTCALMIAILLATSSPLFAQPVITNVAPYKGNPGSTVTLTGSNFYPVAAGNIVYFGATRAIVTGVTGTTSLTVTVPSGATYARISSFSVTGGLTGFSSLSFLPTYNNAAYAPGVVNYDDKVDLATHTDPLMTAIADLDNDGKPDIVVTNSGTAEIAIYRNISSSGTLTAGSFALPVYYATSVANGIAITDLNSDNKPDIILAHPGSDEISVMRNKSTTGIDASSFDASYYYSTAGHTRNIAVADIDGDGKVDIAAAGTDNVMSVFHNSANPGPFNGSSFDSRTDFLTSHPASGATLMVRAGDLNGDNKPELVFVNSNGYTGIVVNDATPGFIDIGSFASIWFYPTNATETVSIAIGDLDNDGRPDLAVTNTLDDVVTVHHNNFFEEFDGNTFLERDEFAAGARTHDIAIADIDGDGKPDLITANIDDGTVSILRNKTSTGVINSASFASKVDFATSGEPNGLAVGDLDGDGKPDIVAVCSLSENVSILRNKALEKIAGNNSICVGATTSLTDNTTGGVWSTPNTDVATVSSSGLVTGLSAGDAVISYTVLGGAATMTVTVNALPVITAINGDEVCADDTLRLTSAATGSAPLAYSWTGPLAFSNTGQNQEIISAPLAATGTYTLVIADVNGCKDTATASGLVNPVPVITAIGAGAAICEEKALSLSSTVTGGTAGYTFSWSGPNSFSSGDEDPLVTSSATIAANGVYQLIVADANGCSDTGAATVTVYPIQPIVGSDTVTFGLTITLSDPVPGGSWSTPTPWTTKVTSGTGAVKGVSAGISQISYTTTQGCVAMHTVTVMPGRNACVGQTMMISDGTSGGTWASANGSIASVGLTTGIITGVSAGNTVITHRSSSGTVATTITVNPLAATTAAPASVCQGQTLSLVNNTAGGGTWYSGNTATAAVSASGIATGVSGGTVTIYYTPHAGCVTAKTITIIPVTQINGPASVCAGQTVSVSNSTPGGVWSTSSGALATVSSTGLVKGIAAGYPRVSYIWPNGCQAVKTMTVNTLSQITGGTPGICASNSMTLANATPFGGVWSSSNSSAATVHPTTGFVKGTGAGSTVISFTTNASGCVATRNVTVNACRESGTTTVAEAATEDNIKLYPNPNNGQFTLAGTIANVTEDEVGMEIVNMLGQVIYRSNIQVRNSRIQERLELPGTLARGTYILNLRTNSGNKLFRFVID